MRNKNSLITIIIPTFNQAHLLAETVQTVLDQGFIYSEVLVIDDGSTDQTSEVMGQLVNAFPDRVHYFYQTRQGFNMALNQGVVLAQGSFIGFIEPGDNYCEQSLLKRYTALVSRPNLMMVFGSSELEKESLEQQWFLDEIFNDVIEQDGVFYTLGHDFHKTLLTFSECPIQLSAVLIRKHAMQVVGSFRADLYSYDYLEFWLRFLKQYRVGYLDVPLSTSRHSLDQSLPESIAERLFSDPIRLSQEIYKRFEKDKNIRPILRRKLATQHRKLGEHYHNHLYYSKALGCSLKSLFYDPASPEAYRLLGRSLLP